MSFSVIFKIIKNGKVFAVKQIQKERITLGSSADDVDLFLDGDASALHAVVQKNEDGFKVIDQNSASGTFKNGDKILEASIKDGDTLTVGEFTIEVSFAEGAAVAAYTDSGLATETGPAEATQVISDDNLGSTGGPSSGSKPSHSASSPSAPQVMGAGAASGGGVFSASTSGFSGSSAGSGLSTQVTEFGRRTYAPSSPYRNVNEFVRPTKGTLVEILVCWGERVIRSTHFNEKGTIHVGTRPDCEIVVPLISTNVDKVPLVQLDSAAVIILHPGLEGSIVSDNEAIPFSELERKGRASGNMVPLQQGEMARISLGGQIELIVRYASQAPKPLMIPFIDPASQGFLAVMMAVVTAMILSLFVALQSDDKLDEEKEESRYRAALLLDNLNLPPPPPRPKKKKVEKKPPVKKKIVKVKPKKSKPKVVKADFTKKSPNKSTGGASGTKGIKNDSTAKALVKTKSKNKNTAGSVKKGGSIKTTNKKAAQAKSERKVEQAGLFSVFSKGGANNRIDTEYQGKGTLAGLADKASGTSGFTEDRAGKGLGSKLKETGGGKGNSNVGVTGIKGSGTGLGSGGFGNKGLGNRKGVSIEAGGGGEEYSGSIDKDGIRRVFFQNSKAIRSCYERALNQAPNLGGKILLDFDIGEQGRVVGSPSVKVNGSTLRSRTVSNCILARLKTWRFPEPPKNQVVNVVYPLQFSSK